ncbi:MAG: AraC family transcriptional regulator, partial [Clostridia bacterium]
QMEELLNCAGMEQLQARMLQMVAELRDSEPASANSEATNTVKKVLRIIRHEYASVLSLDCLAERTGLTPSYLSTLFKQETGENLIKYITDYRLKQACAMLEEGSTKVNQVAKACGYDNVSYFNRIFKAHYGITPSSLRGREEE